MSVVVISLVVRAGTASDTVLVTSVTVTANLEAVTITAAASVRSVAIIFKGVCSCSTIMRLCFFCFSSSFSVSFTFDIFEINLSRVPISTDDDDDDEENIWIPNLSFIVSLSLSLFLSSSYFLLFFTILSSSPSSDKLLQIEKVGDARREPGSDSGSESKKVSSSVLLLQSVSLFSCNNGDIEIVPISPTRPL